ncbi:MULTISPECIES: ATP synthase subunit I [Pasteurellaceae]|uniref:ATP synthase subunit I n=1 Tax=Pasteurellaceae TaxID=712 RepID=UPI000509B589
MSAIIKQAKRQYQFALGIELLVLLVIFSVLIALQWNIAVSFVLGAISVFIPHCFFAASVFFTERQYANKLSAFYRGEVIKFVFTIILIIVAFKLFLSMNFIAFFAGYFLGLVLNNLLPFLISKYVRI